MRILVTGAAGFVGSALCVYLRVAGHEVRRGVRVHDGLVNTFETTSPESVGEAVRGVECIIHLAGCAHRVREFNRGQRAVNEKTDVALAEQLAWAAHRAGVCRFVLVSSIKVCGEASPDGPLAEEVIPAPYGPYAICRWEIEQALREVERKSRIEVVIVRPVLIYGEGVKGSFLGLLSAVYFGVPLPFARLTNKRSFLYLPNLISALAACAVHPKAAGETFHISDDQSVTLPQLVRELSMAMGRPTRTISCPESALLRLGKLVGMQRLVGSFVNDLEVSSAKIRNFLEWSPPYTLQQGIQETAAWYLGRANSTSDYSANENERHVCRKICQLCAVDFTAKHLLLPLVDGLLDKGWSVTSVCSGGKYIGEMDRRRYRHVTISIVRGRYEVFAHVRTVWLLYRLFRRERFDVLHVHTPVAALLGRIAGKLAGVPLIVYTAHGFYFHDQMPKFKYRFYVFLERLSGRLTDLLFVQSREDASTAVAEGIADQSNVVEIGNGVNIDAFDSGRSDQKLRVRASLGIPDCAYVVGVIARRVQEKGLVEFLEAAVQLGQHSQDVCFLMVGERLASDHDVSVERELNVAKNKLGSRLVVLGYRSDVADLLGAMDIFCLPSYREGMPRSIIEAMMMGLPVVATNIRGSREEVVPGETGLLVPTHNSAALAGALRTLIADPDLSRRMGKAGRQRALKLYDERRVVARQIDAIMARCHGA